MATRICPNCKADSFTWTTDEQETYLTKWGCYECNYVAYEDESLEKECSACKKKTNIKLEDTSKKYWWCSNCNKITEIEMTE
jgi:phage FluMu protein Com